MNAGTKRPGYVLAPLQTAMKKKKQKKKNRIKIFSHTKGQYKAQESVKEGRERREKSGRQRAGDCVYIYIHKYRHIYICIYMPTYTRNIYVFIHLYL